MRLQLMLMSAKLKIVRLQFRNGAIWALIALFLTNQIAPIVHDFKMNIINNGNCTEWSAIWCEINRVITKLHDREAGVQFVSTSLISHQNCTTRSAISTLLYSF